MAESRKVVNLLGAAGVALFALTGGALADGYEGSIKDAPVAPAREFTYSFGVTGTSDYVFRGISQTDNDPDHPGRDQRRLRHLLRRRLGFGPRLRCRLGNDAEIEADWYAGIKPTWGPADVRLRRHLLHLSRASYHCRRRPDLDYIEYKAGVSGSPITEPGVGRDRLLL